MNYKFKWYLPGPYLYDWLSFIICFTRVILGRKILLAIFGNLGKTIARLNKREKSIAIAQINYAIREGYLNSNTNPDKLFKENFAHVFQSALDVFLLPYYCSSEQKFAQLVDINSSNINDTATDRGDSSGIFLTGHVGLFELAPIRLLNSDIPTHPVARYPNNKILRALSKRQREKFDIETIWRKKGDSPKALLNAMKKNHCIGALLDQDTAINGGFYPFMGLPSNVPDALIHMAIRKNLPVYLYFAIRKNNGKYLLHSEDLIYENNSNSKANDIIALYHRKLEQIIKENPKQWIWWHRRWRRRPKIDYEKNKELLPSTKEYIKWLNIQ